ncbi:hypothetical protein Q9X96_003097 [Vibrio vulnificus]|nr:hypothetical protein [Vibrio vulnificus]ELH4810064.1 hypothetical protein [Vibrio vulnificus]
MNIVSPFTNDAKNQIEGLLIQLIRNQNVTEKKNFKSSEELLPYLKEYPDYLEHPLIKKVNSLLSNLHSDEQTADLMNKIAEEIQQEKAKEEPDEYLIHRLAQIYFKHNKATD